MIDKVELNAFGRNVKAELGDVGEVNEGSFRGYLFGLCDKLSSIRIVEDLEISC